MATLNPVINAMTLVKRKLLLRTRALQFIGSVRKERVGIRLLSEALVDVRYGGWCGGLVAKNPKFPDSSRVQSSRYDTLKRLFSSGQVAVRPADVLVDVGCGKGRAINFWLHQGYHNRILGIDLHEQVARHTAERLRGFANVVILIGDAVDLVPQEGTVFYLYNPFGAETLDRFATRLLEVSLDPAQIRIVYLNARHKNVFQNNRRWGLQALQSGTSEEAVLAYPRFHHA
jgi:SAM-dependent methyltransferase